MPNITAIEEAAHALASAVKGEGVLTTARTALEDMKHAVETMLGREVEVIKRTSRSTGTERFSFVLGESGLFKAKSGAALVAETEGLATQLDGSKDVLEHLRSRGLTVEEVHLHADKPGVFRPAVDVVLDENVLGYVPGQRTAAMSAREAVKPVGRTIPTVSAIDEAAQVLAAGKGEGALTVATTRLADMKRAVETILGREVEVIKRTSRSTGTERFSFVLGKSRMSSVGLSGPEAAKAEEAAIVGAGEALEVLQHFKSRGLTAEGVSLHADESGFFRPAVDVVLDDKVLGYIPGQNAASATGRDATGKSIL